MPGSFLIIWIASALIVEASFFTSFRDEGIILIPALEELSTLFTMENDALSGVLFGHIDYHNVGAQGIFL